MYYFKKKNGVSLCNDDKELLTGITPWVNTRVMPNDSHGRKDIVYLNPMKLEENSVSFTNAEGIAVITLTVAEKTNCFALFAKGKYDPTGFFGHGTHLNEYYGIGFDFDIPHTGNYIDAFMNCTYWQRPFIGSDLSDIRPRTQMLLLNTADGKSEYFMTVCHKDFKTELFPAGNKASLAAHANCVKDSIDECIFIGGIGNDTYRLPETVAGFGMKIMNKSGTLRKYKKYPEMFEYLGWCSWDAFHMDVTDKNLLDKAAEFKNKSIPVRWMIIDDMWGDVTCIDRRTMHTRELNDWEADPVRFPAGLKAAVNAVKKNYGMCVGIWHPTSGYWNGINPEGKLALRYPELFEYTVPIPEKGETKLIHSFDLKKAEKYYSLQYSFYKDCGAYFVKVDNQGSTENFSHTKGSIGKCASVLHHSVEKAVKKYFDGTMINCMGMPVENFWNRGYSAVNRFSGDFMPEDRKWFIQHLLQCSFNSLTQGAVFTGDWDMWWSDDKQAVKNAVIRSMSGGPVYMSDELGRSIRNVIMPLVFADGRIVRMKNPALPSPECLFADSEHNGKIFKLFNLAGNCGAVAAFNLDENEAPVSGTISASDMKGLKPGKYCVYDWFAEKAVALDANDAIELTLNDYDDFRLYIFSPIRQGTAVMGLTDKYMCPATVEISGDNVKALDAGRLTVYSENTISGFDSLSDKLYVKSVNKNETVTI